MAIAYETRRIVMVELDKPTCSAKCELGSASQWIATHLALEPTQYQVLTNIEALKYLCFDDIAGVVICGLWHSESYWEYRSTMVNWLVWLYQQSVPIFAFGEGHLYLAEALGGRVSDGIISYQIGKHVLQTVNSDSEQWINDNELHHASTVQTTFSTALHFVKNKPDCARSLLQDTILPNYFLKYHDLCYSIQPQVGITWSAMVMWLAEHPAYWHVNTQVLEHRQSEQWGIGVLKGFVHFCLGIQSQHDVMVVH